MSDQERKWTLFAIFGSKCLKYIVIGAVTFFLGWKLLEVIENSIQNLSGKETEVAVTLNFVLKTALTSGITVAVVVFYMLYARRANRLRQASIEKMSAQIQHLEKKMNPDRETSGLTSKGTTREEDKW